MWNRTDSIANDIVSFQIGSFYMRPIWAYLFVDLVALSNGLHGPVQMDWVAPPPWNTQCSSFRYKCLSGLHEWNLDYLVLKHAFNCRCIVSKDTGEITVEQKRINNALLENHNAIIKLVTKATSGYQSWERFRNGCMLILEKASILKSTRMTEALKWLKKGPEQQNVVRVQYQL